LGCEADRLARSVVRAANIIEDGHWRGWWLRRCSTRCTSRPVSVGAA